jgi:glycosyltransferase involved in cell wall biosynthesis
MRFGWISDAVNQSEGDLHYELFRPWRRYDAIVFLKSMGGACLTLARRLKKEGLKILFDANVDYLTTAEGTFYYEGMAPTEAQRQDALAMMAMADAVIADSEYIAGKCLAYQERVEWIPDNVKMSLVPLGRPKKKRNRLTVLWSGVSFKIFELLLIAPLLQAHAHHIHLILVTDNWAGVERCFEPYRRQIKDLLSSLDHEIIPFQSIEQLLSVYTCGDVFVSPRFLNNTYNMGHTEWKITLPMACGLFVLASPQPSYQTVNARSEGKGLRICHDMEDWSREMDALISHKIDLDEEGSRGRQVVKRYYATDVIAAQHGAFLRRILADHADIRIDLARTDHSE